MYLHYYISNTSIYAASLFSQNKKNPATSIAKSGIHCQIGTLVITLPSCYDINDNNNQRIINQTRIISISY
jgi:hypothetical protein